MGNISVQAKNIVSEEQSFNTKVDITGERKKQLHFTKMHGCGNDYIYINCLDSEISSPQSLAISLSNRHFGIGGDGIVLICRSNVADAKMRMFNIDGSEGKMCGNAIRCIAKYLHDNKTVLKTEMHIETLSGIKYLKLFTENSIVTKVTVDMGLAELSAPKIPVNLPYESVIQQKIEIENETYAITCVSMGNPHCVVFYDKIDNLDVAKLGTKFENHPIFPNGVNTEFVEVIDRNTIKMRVWERGSGETLSCGTGACAATVAAVLSGFCNKGDDILVILQGGKLIINYTDARVLMTGDATKVFDGVIMV